MQKQRGKFGGHRESGAKRCTYACQIVQLGGDKCDPKSRVMEREIERSVVVVSSG